MQMALIRETFHCENFARYILKSVKQHTITRFSKEWSVEMSERTIQAWNSLEKHAKDLEMQKCKQTSSHHENKLANILFTLIRENLRCKNFQLYGTQGQNKEYSLSRSMY